MVKYLRGQELIGSIPLVFCVALFAAIAQMVEREFCKLLVMGSIPIGSSILLQSTFNKLLLYFFLSMRNTFFL
jgi:hypothetical protein